MDEMAGLLELYICSFASIGFVRERENTFMHCDCFDIDTLKSPLTRVRRSEVK